MEESNQQLRPADERLRGIEQELASSDWQVRELAVFKLSEYESGPIVEMLVRALGDEAAEVRETAAGIIGERAMPEAVDSLVENYRKYRMTDPNFPWALGRIRSPGAADELLDMLPRVHDLPNKERIIWALGELEERRATEQLISLLDTPELAEAALKALGKIEDPRAVEPIKQRFDRLPKSMSLIALGRLGEESIVDLLIGQLDHKFFLYRREAALALAKLGDARAAQAIETRIDQEENEWVVEAMERAVDILRSGSDAG